MREKTRRMEGLKEWKECEETALSYIKHFLRIVAIIPLPCLSVFVSPNSRLIQHPQNPLGEVDLLCAKWECNGNGIWVRKETSSLKQIIINPITLHRHCTNVTAHTTTHLTIPSIPPSIHLTTTTDTTTITAKKFSLTTRQPLIYDTITSKRPPSD